MARAVCVCVCARGCVRVSEGLRPLPLGLARSCHRHAPARHAGIRDKVQ